MKEKRSQHTDIIKKYRTKMEELDKEEELKRVESKREGVVSLIY